jgi:TetR/AcrR family transcriptional regulator
MASAQVRFSAADRRRQILDVATQIFSRQGFQGATTRQIAQQSGVTEALIFRHFPTKDDLYWAVIERKIIAAAGAKRIAETLKGGGSDREILSAIAAQILERRAKDQTLSRLLIYTALENHRLSGRFFRNYVAEYYELLADYIRQGIEQGRFRRVSPLLAARAFLGMVIYHSWIQELYGGKRYQKFSVQEVSETFADLWLRGVLKGRKGGREEDLVQSNNGHHNGKTHASREAKD